MKLKIFDIDKDLKEITTSKFHESGKLTKSGIFSQQIFGPVKSYKCACPRSPYRGPQTSEDKCPVCSVDIISSESRRKRYGKITLPFKVMSPLFFNILVFSKPSLKHLLYNFLFFKSKFYINDEKELIRVTPDTVITDKMELLEGIRGIEALVDLLIEKNPTKKEYIFIKNNKDKLFTDTIIVIPPDFRNFSKNSVGTYMTDTLNQYYTELLMRIERIKKLPYDIKQEHDIYKAYFRSIQTFVLNIDAYIYSKLSKKTGLIRGNILGKRVDFSGRAVISPDPDLRLDQCKLPYFVALSILKPLITTYLVNKRICKRYNQAANLIEDSLKKRDFTLYDVVREFCKDRICIINRQPSLHRLSIFSFRMDIHKGNTLKIHPMITSPLNADFDGDSISSYISTTYVDKENDTNPTHANRFHIKDFNNIHKTEFEKKFTRKDGVDVEIYNVLDDVYVNSINQKTGEIESKKVTKFHIHKNLNMYRIERNKKNAVCFDIKDLLVAQDHGLIAWDRENKEIISTTPLDVIKDKSRYFFIRNKKIEFGDNNFKNLLKNINHNSDISESELGYFIGAWLGDGHICKNNNSINIDNTDISIGEHWADILEKLSINKVTRKIKTSVGDNYFHNKVGESYNRPFRWRAHDKNLKKLLLNFGNNSSDKCLSPELFNINSKELLYGLMAGYLDTDGTVNKKKKSKLVSFTSKSEKLIKDISYLLFKYNIKSSVFKTILNYDIDKYSNRIELNNDKSRIYYMLNISISNNTKEFLKNISKYLKNNNKKEILDNLLDEIEVNNKLKMDNYSYDGIKYIPTEIIDDYFDKDKYTLKNKVKKSNITTISREINKETINKISNDLERTLFIKQNNNEIEFIPCAYLNIELDSSETIGYDLTVEDNFTFTTDTGIFVFDCMSIYIPVTEVAIKEAEEKLSIWNTLLSPTDGSIVPTPTQDIVLGIYEITK